MFYMQKFLEDNQLIFEYDNLVRVTVTFVIFLLSSIGNVTVLTSVTIWRRNEELTHTQLIITHLSLANLCFTFFILPMGKCFRLTA